jgi:hypothetical protein
MLFPEICEKKSFFLYFQFLTKKISTNFKGETISAEIYKYLVVDLILYLKCVYFVIFSFLGIFWAKN